MKETTNLELTTTGPREVGEPAQPSVLEIIREMVNRPGVTENVAALKEMVALQERMEDRNAKKAFVAALQRFQAAVKHVQVTRIVPTKVGGIKYKYAPIEDIQREIEGPQQANGFTITFSQRLGPGIVTAICRLTHISGHSESNEYTVRAGKGPHDGTERDADVAASTVAQREALCDALNIVRDREQTEDARNLGSKITADQADDLRRRVRDSKSDEVAFLKLAEAGNFEDIMSVKLEILDQLLSKRERILAQKAGRK